MGERTENANLFSDAALLFHGRITAKLVKIIHEGGSKRSFLLLTFPYGGKTICVCHVLNQDRVFMLTLEELGKCYFLLVAEGCTVRLWRLCFVGRVVAEQPEFSPDAEGFLE